MEELQQELNELMTEHKRVHVPSCEQPSRRIVMMLEGERKLRWFQQNPGLTEEDWLRSEINRYKGFLGR